jgi:hypothetical protein
MSAMSSKFPKKEENLSSAAGLARLAEIFSIMTTQPTITNYHQQTDSQQRAAAAKSSNEKASFTSWKLRWMT